MLFAQYKFEVSVWLHIGLTEHLTFILIDKLKLSVHYKVLFNLLVTIIHYCFSMTRYF